jgi:hypothetical protein
MIWIHYQANQSYFDWFVDTLSALIWVDLILADLNLSGHNKGRWKEAKISEKKQIFIAILQILILYS